VADQVFNVAKGRGVELYNRVKSNDPANSALIVVLGFGSVTDAALRDHDTLQEVIDDANFTEATFTNYVRKVLTDSDLAALPSPDDVNDRYEIIIPDQTWASAGNGLNNTLTRLIICYDSDTTGGIDANILPVSFYDFPHTTNSTNLEAAFDALGFLRAA
jgi:hypothetical protein